MVESRDSEEDESDKSPPRFRFALTKIQCSRMDLPKKFAKEAGLIGKTSVILQYLGRERHWKVALKQRFGLELVAGWREFTVANRLEVRRMYSFEFNFVKNLILVSDCSSTSEPTNLLATVEDCQGIDRVWRCVRELKKYHFIQFKMVMPNTFWRGIGIAKGDNVNLEDGTKKWPVTITDGSNARLTMSWGFKDFLRENHMQVGDIILFESVPNSVDIKFVVMENEVGKEMIVRSGKGGII